MFRLVPLFSTMFFHVPEDMFWHIPFCSVMFQDIYFVLFRHVHPCSRTHVLPSSAMFRHVLPCSTMFQNIFVDLVQGQFSYILNNKSLLSVRFSSLKEITQPLKHFSKCDMNKWILARFGNQNHKSLVGKFPDYIWTYLLKFHLGCKF